MCVQGLLNIRQFFDLHKHLFQAILFLFGSKCIIYTRHSHFPQLFFGQVIAICHKHVFFREGSIKNSLVVCLEKQKKIMGHVISCITKLIHCSTLRPVNALVIEKWLPKQFYDNVRFSLLLTKTFRKLLPVEFTCLTVPTLSIYIHFLLDQRNQFSAFKKYNGKIFKYSITSV